MTRTQTPSERKRLDYQKGRVYFAPFGGRKGPNPALQRKKAKLARVYRHQVQQHLSSTNRLTELDPLADFAPEAIRRKRLQRIGPWRLGDYVRTQPTSRLSHLGRKRGFFRGHYRRSHHREAFIAFLSALVPGRHGQARDIAEYLAEQWECSPVVYPEYAWSVPWLAAFFRDEPAWEPRLRAWVNALTGRELPPMVIPRSIHPALDDADSSYVTAMFCPVQGKHTAHRVVRRDGRYTTTCLPCEQGERRGAAATENQPAPDGQQPRRSQPGRGRRRTPPQPRDRLGRAWPKSLG